MSKIIEISHSDQENTMKCVGNSPFIICRVLVNTQTCPLSPDHVVSRRARAWRASLDFNPRRAHGQHDSSAPASLARRGQRAGSARYNGERGMRGGAAWHLNEY